MVKFMSRFGNAQIKALWSKTQPMVWPGTYWMVAFEPDNWSEVARLISEVPARESYSSVIRDQHEIAAILPSAIWDRHRAQRLYREEFGPLVCITFDVPLDISVSGYLAPVVGALADAGISVVPQCALIYDHVFVHQSDAERAIAEIEALQAEAV